MNEGMPKAPSPEEVARKLRPYLPADVCCEVGGSRGRMYPVRLSRGGESVEGELWQPLVDDVPQDKDRVCELRCKLADMLGRL